jgi:Uma2 family endonuclease
MAQALLLKDDGYSRLAITAQMLEAMVASGTIEDPARVELIEGELITMSPTYRSHARMTARLIGLLGNAVSEDFEVYDGGSLRLNDYNEPVPDICIARACVTTDVLYPADCVLVIEVSESTARQDRQIKAQLYAKAGIPEYWIVDLTISQTVIHRGPSEAGWSDVISVPFAGELVAGFDGTVRVVVEAV